jgi:ATP-dependent helicase HrpB
VKTRGDQDAVETARVLPPAGTPGTDLPVRAALPELAAALRSRGTAVLVAPPGTGKTTLVPLALAGQVQGRVVVAEPRRVAARAAARRMSALLGEPPGRSVGHTVRGESTAGPHTRVEVVTTGVLVRRLQRDAELPGVDAVVLDECHERHLDTDLALAFGVDVRSVLRPDLLPARDVGDARRRSAWPSSLGWAAIRRGARGPCTTWRLWWCPAGACRSRASFGLRVDPSPARPRGPTSCARRVTPRPRATCWCSSPRR